MILSIIGTIISFAIVGACFYALFRSKWVWSFNQKKKKGQYPEKGKATMFDVRRLIIEGEREMAIRVYSELFKVNHQEAKKAVEDLTRSIQQKKTDVP